MGESHGLDKLFSDLPSCVTTPFFALAVEEIHGAPEARRAFREHLKERLRVGGYRKGKLPDGPHLVRTLADISRSYRSFAHFLLKTWWSVVSDRDAWLERVKQFDVDGSPPDVDCETWVPVVPLDTLLDWNKGLSSRERARSVFAMFCVTNWRDGSGNAHSSNSDGGDVGEEFLAVAETLVDLLKKIPANSSAWPQIAELPGRIQVLVERAAEEVRNSASNRDAVAAKLESLANYVDEFEYLELSSVTGWHAELADRDSTLATLDDLQHRLDEWRVARGRTPKTRTEELQREAELRDLDSRIRALHDELHAVLGMAGVDVSAESSETLPGASSSSDQGATDDQASDSLSSVSVARLVDAPSSGASDVFVEGDEDDAPESDAPRDAGVLADESTFTEATRTRDDNEPVPVQSAVEIIRITGTHPLSSTLSRRSPQLANGEWELPEELATFATFDNTHWVKRDGSVQPATWCDSDRHRALVERMFVRELQQPHIRAWFLELLANAAEKLNLNLPSLEHTRCLLFAWANPGAARSVLSPDLVRAFRDAQSSGVLNADLRWRAQLFLLALLPSHGLAKHEVEKGLEAASFSRDLEAVVHWMLQLGAQNTDVLEVLRRELSGAGQPSLDERRKQLTARRREFAAYVTRIRHAGGGKIQRSHCREAWHEFIADADDFLHTLFPVDSGGLTTLGPDTNERLRNLVVRHAEIADRRGALHEDRRAMDRLVRALAEQAGDICACAAAIASDSGAPTPNSIGTPRAELQRLVRATEPADEALFRGILCTIVAGAPNVRFEADVSGTHVIRQPSLLGCLLPQEGTTERWRIDLAVDANRAIEALIEAEHSPEVDEQSSLFESLQDVRPDLLWRAALIPKERDHLRAKTDDLTTRALHLVDELRSNWEVIEAAKPGKLADALSSVCDAASRLLDGRTDAAPGSDRNSPERIAPAVVAWLQLVIRFSERAKQSGEAEIRQQVASLADGELKSNALDALEKGDIAGAAHALHQTSGAGTNAVRMTPFRIAGERQFSNPGAVLAQAGLLPNWVKGIKTGSLKADERKIREEFARFLLKSDGGPALATDEGTIRIRCDEIREVLARRGLNPSYVPQLARFRDMAIATAGATPGSPDFVNNAVRAATRHEGSMVLLLAPGLRPTLREKLIDVLRSRSARAAVVDDIDVCRLLNPGDQRGETLLGLLEVFLEQQKWTDLSPFTAAEGQQVQMEMYVGRREEARRLAETADITRVFSGRKMGKTALLKYIEKQQDKRRLPSGNELRVVYVHAVGIDEPGALVDEIMLSLFAQTEYSAEPAPNLPPGRRLNEALSAFLHAHPKTSLLFVLDEADAFVEREIDRYRNDHQLNTLSWTMRGGIAGHGASDKSGVPRVRFVFVGFRSTQSNEGAWGNWGHVLKLKPLNREEARQLVEGPLARLGIDVSQHADAIAHRCGYQPAVILAFGMRLLQRLESGWGPARRLRETPTVSARDVALTFEQREVKDEILTIVRNNFQQNDAGRVVFGAMLDALSTLAPGESLINAESTILDRLRAHGSGDLTWLGEQPVEKIRSYLREFVDRDLLEEERVGTEWEYRLRFPHHRAAIAPLGQPAILAADVKHLAMSASRGEDRPVPLYADCIEGIRHVLTLRVDETSVVPIAFVPWGLRTDDVIVERALLDSLGLEHQTRWQASNAGSERLTGERLAVIGASPETLRNVLMRRDRSLPAPLFVGGMDLVRAAWRKPLLENDSITADVFGPGRVTEKSLAWWVRRVQGLTFASSASSGAIGAILRATSGIPLLVRKIDDLITGPDRKRAAGEVPEGHLRDVLASRTNWIQEAVRDLARGTTDVALTERERELLALFVALGGDVEYLKDPDFVAETKLGFRPLDPVVDGPAMAVLSLSGLLPGRGLLDGRSESLGDGDALRDLVGAMRDL